MNLTLEANLRRQGRRVTNQRRLILEVVRSTDSHPTADGVFRQVRRRLPRLSLGTVYRNLKLLAERGLIRELDSRAFGRYDGNTTRHDHFTCRRCGRIFDLKIEADRPLWRRAAARRGFVVLDHRIDFYGLCGSCANHRGRAKGGDRERQERRRPG